jgi:endonuclease/exonuclease/phosphatase family metal-dependent hydrolase
MPEQLRRLLPRLVAALAFACLTLPAAAWHGPGHDRITRAAVESLPADAPPFFRAAPEAVAHTSIDPDLFRKPLAAEDIDRTETPNHYLDLEMLEGARPASRFEMHAWCVKREKDPAKVGMLPYAIVEWTQRLTVAFAEHRRWPENEHIRRKCLVYAGLLSHYSADLCMPLHTTIHYNGRARADGSSPKTGIHTKVDALIGKLGRSSKVNIPPAAVKPYPDLRAAVWAELMASHKLVDKVYGLEKQLPELTAELPADGPVAEFTRERHRAAALFTARLLATAWADSAEVEIPDWHNRPVGGRGKRAKADLAFVAAGEGVAVAPVADEGADAAGETVRLATYNIEHFMKMFDQLRLPERSRNRTEQFRDEEDLYEVAATICLPRFDADIIGIQECCDQESLELFNKRWLGGRYEYVKVFPVNVPGQWLGLLAKPGYKVLEVRAKYYLDKDPVDDPAIRSYKRRENLMPGNRLFSRGPAFVKFRTPGGSELWVGVTHVKSKYGNSPAVTRWRIRELERTREICGELAGEDGENMVVMLGDFNDSFGKDRIEKEVGADAVATMVSGEGPEKMTCPSLAVSKETPKLATYHCKIKPPTYRDFIDHIFLSRAAARRHRKTYVIADPVAVVASDHLPVVTVLSLPEKDAGKDAE